MFTATATGQGPRRQHTNSTPVEPSGSFLSSRLMRRLIGRYPSLGYGVPVDGGWLFLPGVLPGSSFTSGK